MTTMHIHYGVERIYWDDEELTGPNGKNTAGNAPMPLDSMDGKVDALRPDDGRVFMAEIATGGQNSGHQLTIEFTTGSRAGYLSIRTPELTFPAEFARCEDDKVCLVALGKRGNAGRELRESNHLQIICLEASWQTVQGGGSVKRGKGKEPTDIPGLNRNQKRVCKEWRGCLRNGGFSDEVKLLTMLRAAGLSTLTSITNVSSTASIEPDDKAQTPLKNGRGGKRCMDPVTEDVESWECDCFADMNTRCEAIDGSAVHYSLAGCLAAQFCIYPNVCEDWKSANCNSVATKSLITALGVAKMSAAIPKGAMVSVRSTLPASQSSGDSDKTALLSRSHSALRAKSLIEAQDTALDETISAKQCN